MPGTSGSKLEIAIDSAPDLAEDSYAPRWIETLKSLRSTTSISRNISPIIPAKSG
jgi:hypothetical protein